MAKWLVIWSCCVLQMSWEFGTRCLLILTALTSSFTSVWPCWCECFVGACVLQWVFCRCMCTQVSAGCTHVLTLLQFPGTDWCYICLLTLFRLCTVLQMFTDFVPSLYRLVLHMFTDFVPFLSWLVLHVLTDFVPSLSWLVLHVFTWFCLCPDWCYMYLLCSVFVLTGVTCTYWLYSVFISTGVTCTYWLCSVFVPTGVTRTYWLCAVFVLTGVTRTYWLCAVFVLTGVTCTYWLCAVFVHADWWETRSWLVTSHPSWNLSRSVGFSFHKSLFWHPIITVVCSVLFVSKVWSRCIFLYSSGPEVSQSV